MRRVSPPTHLPPPTVFDQTDRMDCAKMMRQPNVCHRGERKLMTITHPFSPYPMRRLLFELSLSLGYSLSVLAVLYAMCDSLCSKCTPSNMSGLTVQTLAVSCPVLTTDLNNVAMPLFFKYKAKQSSSCLLLSHLLKLSK